MRAAVVLALVLVSTQAALATTPTPTCTAASAPPRTCSPGASWHCEGACPPSCLCATQTPTATCPPSSPAPECGSGDNAVCDQYGCALGCQCACPGDCNQDGAVSVSELIVGVRIAIGAAAPSSCLAMTCDCTPGERCFPGARVECLVRAVNAAVDGCPGATTPTPTPTPRPLATCAPTLGIPSYCSTDCPPCPTIRAGCNAVACQDCIEIPTCAPHEVCAPWNPSGANAGCCSCVTPTPTCAPVPPPATCPPGEVLGCEQQGCSANCQCRTATPTRTPDCSNSEGVGGCCDFRGQRPCYPLIQGADAAQCINRDSGRIRGGPCRTPVTCNRSTGLCE